MFCYRGSEYLKHMAINCLQFMAANVVKPRSWIPPPRPRRLEYVYMDLQRNRRQRYPFYSWLHGSFKCKLPQKEYVLKIEKTVTLKRINNEENKIQSSSDCWHFEVL